MSEVFSLDGKRIWVAGHLGMVGSAVTRRLMAEPVGELITASRAELDLRRQTDVERFVAETRPDALVLAAAKVGGIHANRSAQAEFLYDNLLISANAIEACRRFDVQRVVVLGSSCVYPREAPQPIREEYLLTGPLEPTNEGYAVAKIAALEMGKMYRQQYGLDVISLMPTNLYGPNDNFDLQTAHVLPAMLRKIHEAKFSGSNEVKIWGTGRPRREFLHVDDAAEAVVFCLRSVSGASHLNVGCGEDVSIRELAELLASVIGWHGEFSYQSDMPDGMMQKLLDVSQITTLGWSPTIALEDGLRTTYQWFLDHADSLRGK
jgi:GDP-L-fucose synthase